MCAWDFDRRDPWEAVEAVTATKTTCAGRTGVSDDPLLEPRARTAARLTCSRLAAGCRCASTAETRRSISRSSAPAPAAARWPAGWPKRGSPSSRLDAGPWWRPLEDFASDEAEQTKLYWTDERIFDGDNPLQLGSNNSGKAVGGSTVHFAMVSLRFRPEWFKSRSLLGYGADWPLDWREMWRYYAEVEQALKIAGPVNYPWGPKRPRYPYRAHELNAAALVLARRLRGAGHYSGPRRRSRRCPRRAAWRIPASIAASASSVAPPMPSRARWSPGSRARSRPARKSAIWRWSDASR